MPAWERTAAKLTHWAFYGLMIGIPLSGWIYVSAQWRGDIPLNVPTLWFGLFEVPHLFGLNEAANATRQLLANLSMEAHEALAFSTEGLLGLHVAAALKHHFINHDDVLSHMIPALEKPGTEPSPINRGRRLVLIVGLSFIPLAALAILASLFLDNGKTTQSKAIENTAQSQWQINPANSTIRFSGSHAGTAFQGEFSRWQIDIQFDPENPANGSITASIDTASASDGIPLHDETLPLEEWFNVEQHPTAAVRSTSILRISAATYKVDGILSIKGHEVPLSNFDMQIEGPLMQLSGSVTLNRADIDLGMESDPQGEWVALNIPVTLQLEAIRK